MSITLAAVTLDCEDAAGTAQFWSAALGRPTDPDPSEHFASIGMDGGESNAWLFLKVPEPRTVKDRMHIDFVSDDREAEVARLIELGATRVHDQDEAGFHWTTLQDPFGNEFCIADSH